MKFLLNDPGLKQRRRELRKNQTDAEKAFWDHVRNRQFLGMKFFRQYSVGPYILDFYCPDMNLAVELDGGQHHEPAEEGHDAARSGYLQERGIDVLRFWNHDVLLNMEGVLARVKERITPPNLPLSKGRRGGRGLSKGRRKSSPSYGKRGLGGVSFSPS